MVILSVSPHLDDDSSSFNGLKCHNVYKDWTQERKGGGKKKPYMSSKTFKLLWKCNWKNTLKASLKGLGSLKLQMPIKSNNP